MVYMVTHFNYRRRKSAVLSAAFDIYILYP